MTIKQAGKRRYYVSGGVNSHHQKWWERQVKHSFYGTANFCVCKTYAHALRQWKRTPVREEYSQIDLRVWGMPRKVNKCIKAWRYYEA